MKSSAELIQAAKELFGVDYLETTNAVVMHEMKTASYFRKPYAEMFNTVNVLIKHMSDRSVILAMEPDNWHPDNEEFIIEVDDPDGYLTEGLESDVLESEEEIPEE